MFKDITTMKELALDINSMTRYARQYGVSLNELTHEEVERFRAYRVPEREVNVIRDVCSDKWTATSRDIFGMPIADASLDSLVEWIISAVHVYIESNSNENKKGLIIRVAISDEKES